jgi:hypothetical protein
MNVQFLYTLDNLFLYTPDIIHIIIGVVLSVIFLAALTFIYLYSVGYTVLWREKRALANKKNTLSDLILMKDIQTEMEKEIEQATLKATFQG